MSKDLGSKDLSEEELDFGLLDESDDDIVEVEELPDTSTKLQQEKMKQPGGSGDPMAPKQRTRFVLILILFLSP